MNDCTVTAIIQAHMSSTRLPSKIMLDFCGQPMLYRVIERARRSSLLQDVVVATSVLPCDDIIVSACREWGVPCCRGSDSDVLARYWETAQLYRADAYMRLTSDNPLIDPQVLDEAIRYFQTHDYRYIHTDSQLPLGMGAELFDAALLDEAMTYSSESYEHEHVTPYMYWKQNSVGVSPVSGTRGSYRLTVDTPEDYRVVRSIYDALYPQDPAFSLEDILQYLEQHPELVRINESVRQKQVKP